MSILDRALRMGEAKQFKQYAKRVDRINAWEPELELLDDDELRAQRRRPARARRATARPLEDLLPETFALVREVSRRTMGMRHFDVQMIGGMVLHDGAIAEMKTGEGKTLTATHRRGAQRAGRRGRPRRHRQRLPGPPRRRLDAPDLRGARPHRRRAAEHAALRGEARRPTRPTSRTARTPSSASTTCATTWPRRWRRRSSTAAASTRTASRSPRTTSRSSTRSTTSSSTRRGRR